MLLNLDHKGVGEEPGHCIGVPGMFQESVGRLRHTESPYERKQAHTCRLRNDPVLITVKEQPHSSHCWHMCLFSHVCALSRGALPTPELRRFRCKIRWHGFEPRAAEGREQSYLISANMISVWL